MLVRRKTVGDREWTGRLADEGRRIGANPCDRRIHVEILDGCDGQRPSRGEGLAAYRHARGKRDVVNRVACRNAAHGESLGVYRFYGDMICASDALNRWKCVHVVRGGKGGGHDICLPVAHDDGGRRDRKPL